jgi:two-component system C4-dicarboxylate transport sensor histidine kinase DctB
MFKRWGKKQTALALATLLAGVAAVWYGALYAEEVVVAKLGHIAQERLLLYESTLHAALNRHRYLPYILSLNPEILALLERGGDPTKINDYLEAVNKEAGPAALYVMNARGITVATSNWQTPQSYMGHDFSFRPYFREAIKGNRGIFYGIGVNTKEPGFFLSCPIRHEGRVIGAAVVKVELNRLQKEWREGGETVLVSDQNQVIVLASREEWVYSSLIPRDPATLASIQAQEQYRGVSLSVAPTRRGQRAGTTELSIGQERFLLGSRPLEGLGWDINFLEPVAKVEEQTRAVAGIGVTALLLLALLVFLARERHLRRVTRLKAVEAKRIHQINQQLEAEVEQRRRKEQELQDTQNELIHAGQMAALGQMAASVAHELNQPLAAIRMFSANSKVMLRRGQNEGVLDNLETIHELTGRLAAVASQLKNFARKSAGREEEVDLRQPLANALVLLGHQALSMGCIIDKALPPEPLMVLGNAMHLEQVFVNLLQNSLDAIGDCPRREIKISLRHSGDWSEAVLTDSGPGLSPEAKDRLFSPFFTTKEPGRGLGLGLSIIHGIIRSMNGEISGENLAQGGACFTVRLPWHDHG